MPWTTTTLTRPGTGHVADGSRLRVPASPQTRTRSAAGRRRRDRVGQPCFGYSPAPKQGSYVPSGQRECQVPDCGSREARLYPGGNLCDTHKPGPQQREHEHEREAA